MINILYPWQLLLIILAGWMNRHQQDANSFLHTQNQVLMELLGNKRILLTEDQRRRQAGKGKVLGRKALGEVATIVTPDTIMRWHRRLVANKWDYSDRVKKRPGRPALAQEVQELVVKIARENTHWGYDRIQGALANLGYKLSDQTVGNILKNHGIEPAPDRKRQTTWKTFLKAHWDVLAAVDFTTIEVWTKKGLVTYYLLFAIELATRRVQFAGSTTSPDDIWMKQIARNLTDDFDGLLCNSHYLLMDRDTKFSDAFRDSLRRRNVDPVRLPPRSPNLNAYIERFMRSIKDECLDRMIFFGERSLRHAIRQYLEHYHAERNHQGLENQLIDPGRSVGKRDGSVRTSEHLGGMLRYYYRDAA